MRGGCHNRPPLPAPLTCEHFITQLYYTLSYSSGAIGRPAFTGAGDTRQVGKALQRLLPMGPWTLQTFLSTGAREVSIILLSATCHTPPVHRAKGDSPVNISISEPGVLLPPCRRVQQQTFRTLQRCAQFTSSPEQSSQDALEGRPCSAMTLASWAEAGPRMGLHLLGQCRPQTPCPAAAAAHALHRTACHRTRLALSHSQTACSTGTQVAEELMQQYASQRVPAATDNVRSPRPKACWKDCTEVRCRRD